MNDTAGGAGRGIEPSLRAQAAAQAQAGGGRRIKIEPLRRLLPYVTRYRGRVTAAFVALVVAALTTLFLSVAVSERERASTELADARRTEGERAAEERRRIARDLHDSVSQALFSTVLHARAADGMVRGGPEGSERLIAVLFVDLRGSTALGEAKLPYDLLYILNQFFDEMTKALDATGGHYAQFAGDGLLALYGLRAGDPAVGAAAALRGAREMLARVARLDSRLRGDLLQPLRIGIGIHFGEAIVGAMGPPGAQVVTAIGETVNACARLERLTRRYDCPVIVSRRAAEVAGLAVGRELHRERVDGGTQTVEFYALGSPADLPV